MNFLLSEFPWPLLKPQSSSMKKGISWWNCLQRTGRGERNREVSAAAGKWLWGHHHGLAAATFLHPTSQTCSNHRKVNSEQSALLGREKTLLPDAICVVHYLHRFCICLSCSFIFCLQNSLFSLCLVIEFAKYYKVTLGCAC